MKAYSLDFREKIVSAYKAGNTSIRKIAERLMVTKRTVHRLIKQKEETGDLQFIEASRDTAQNTEVFSE
jgi:putative transposase